MKKRKNKKCMLYLIAILIIIFMFVIFRFYYLKCDYEWEKIQDSSVEQYKLYVNDYFGNHINGIVTITYINGKSENVKISKNGIIYIKSIIKSVDNPKRS